MPISPYLRDLRRQIGSALIVLPSVGAVVRHADGRVLLVHDASTDAWVLPGGAVDPDESPTDALVREVWEETGLHVEPRAVLGVYGGRDLRVHYGNGDRVSYVLTAFLCHVLGGEIRPDGDETLDVAWIPPTAFADVPHPPWLDRIAADLLGGDAGPHFARPTWRPTSG